MKNRVLTFCLFMLINVVLIACSSGNKENTVNVESQVEGNKVLRVAMPTQPPTLDPVITTADPTRDVTLQIFEPLVTINENLQPAPLLAESYDVGKDGKTITFNLREGVKFHDGSEMIAEDVVASMKRWQEHSSRAKSAFHDAEFKEEDEYTVVMELQEPNSTALSVLSATTQFPAIMPKEIVESADEEGIKEYIGTGPFKFEEWKQDEYITLSKFDDYSSLEEDSDGLAGKREALVDELKLEIVTDSSTRVAGIMSGEYDLILDVPYDNYDLIETNDMSEIYTDPAGYNVLVFNKAEGVLSDKSMRQAVVAALNMEEILVASHTDEQFFKLNGSLFLEEQTDWYTTAGTDLYNSQDKELVQKLMDKAEYNGEPIKLITSREFEDFYNASVVIKEQLENVGIAVDLEVYDWSTVVDKRKDPSAYDGFVTEWAIINDPTQLIYLDSENEWDGWTDSPEIDKYIKDIRLASDQKEATAINEKLQEEVYDYVPVLKFGDKNFLHAHNKTVDGFMYLNGMSFWNTSKE